MGGRIITSLALLGLAQVQVRASDSPAGIAFFESNIRPVLVEKCYSCHSAAAPKLKGKLRLDSRESMRQGGESGPAVVPENPSESLLLRAIAYTDDFSRMPPREKLPDGVIADFQRWVAMGAPDPRVAVQEGETVAGSKLVLGSAGASPSRVAPASERERNTWWSLEPITNPRVPRLDPDEAAWARTPIDAFIIARLRQQGLKPAPEADRRTLIRRLSFDLIGLPPRPEEVSVLRHRRITRRL